MPERVVNLGGLRDVFVAQLAAAYELVAVDDPRAATATAAVTTGGTGISAAQIAALPRLRVVSGFGVGYDRVDIAAARARGIVVTNTPGLTDRCVADHAIALFLAVARRVAEGSPYEIAFADTIGVGVPSQVAEIFGRACEALPGARLRGHFHNTRNTGLANAYAAVQAGAATLDSSSGGIGGCPFAPAATGNIPTEDLVYLLSRSGVATGVDLERLIATGEWLQQALGRPVPGMLVKAGSFPKAPAQAA